MEKLFTTRKIHLLIDSDDIDQKNKILETLYQWRYICFKAANQIYTHHYVQQQLREMLYLTEGVRAKLSDIKKDEYGMLSISRMNTSYQVSKLYGKGTKMGIWKDARAGCVDCPKMSYKSDREEILQQ